MMVANVSSPVEESMSVANSEEHVQSSVGSKDQLGREKLRPKPILFVLVIVSFLVGLGMLSYQVMTRNRWDQTVTNMDKAQVQLSHTPTPTPLNFHGMATTIKTLPTDIQWRDQELSYDVQNVYAIASPSAELLPVTSGAAEQLIIFAIQATDTRTFGAPRVVPARNYVNIRRQSQDFPPLGQDTQQLEPGQTTTVYVPFAAPESEQKITGLLGNLRNPYVVELDFSQGQLFEGTFDPILGFQTTLEVQATPIP